MNASLHSFLAAHVLMFRLPPDQAFYTYVSLFPMMATWVTGHETAHWLAGRMFGISGRLVVFGRRGVSKLWFISVFAISFKDHEAYYSISRTKRRVIAGAGPVWDLACVALPYGIAVVRAVLGHGQLAGVRHFSDWRFAHRQHHSARGAQRWLARALAG
jgi:hypothetical protein